eukprot:5322731-Pleurochrysis_carterae.AAC.1
MYACACACCPLVRVRVRAHVCERAAVTLSFMKLREGVVAVFVVELPEAEEKKLRTMRFTCTQHREQKVWNQIATKRITMASKT